MLQMSSKVSKNDTTEAIDTVLDAVEQHLSEKPTQAKDMYQLILGSLKQTNERLWFATSLRLGKLYLDAKNFEQLNSLIYELKLECRISSDKTDLTDQATYDMTKGNLLLQAFALEIQMCIETKEHLRMKKIFSMTKNFTSVIEDPRVKGIIQECGGKMYMSEKRWALATAEFFDSFKNLVECGSDKASTILKYLILSSMLADSEGDYLETQEAQVFKDHPEILAMNQLRSGF